MIAYRIFDDKDGRPHTLFHAVNGTRRLPTDTWIEADVKAVTDGSGLTSYQSGFHLLKTRKQAVEVLTRTFKLLDKRVIAKVHAIGLWPKTHSRHNVVLSKLMYVKEKDWRRRLKFKKGGKRDRVLR
jgi:hypothetical protein